MANCKGEIQHTCPNFFGHWDADPANTDETDAASLCKRLWDYMDSYIAKHRGELATDRINVLQLHELLVVVKNTLREHMEVVRAYRWHQRFHEKPNPMFA